MSNSGQSREDVYNDFKKKLQQEFDMKFETDRKRQYFNGFFNSSNTCQEFKKKLFLSEKQIKQLMFDYFEVANHEICKQATQYFDEKKID